jgi:protein-S-isoprenylcysteine O-methyltransferase Ste14
MVTTSNAPGPLDQPEPDRSDTLPKVAVFLFGAVVYAAVWVILIYIVGFVGNFFGPFQGSGVDMILPLKSIDMGVQEPFWRAVLIDVGLIVILGLQHSIMPRPWFKRWITRFVPPHMERGVYVIFAMAALWLLMFQWRPITTPVWQVDNPFLRGLLNAIQVGGWLTVLLATAQVGHWKIFGVTQTLDYIRDKPYTRASYHRLPDEFYKTGWPVTAKGVWHYARHPDFFGFTVAFWVTPSMTVGHLILAVGLTLYIMIGIFLLETNLKQLYGRPYEDYVAIRSKLIPWGLKPPRRATADAPPQAETGKP